MNRFFKNLMVVIDNVYFNTIDTNKNIRLFGHNEGNCRCLLKYIDKEIKKLEDELKVSEKDIIENIKKNIIKISYQDSKNIRVGDEVTYYNHRLYYFYLWKKMVLEIEKASFDYGLSLALNSRKIYNRLRERISQPLKFNIH